MDKFPNQLEMIQRKINRYQVEHGKKKTLQY